MKNSNKKLLTPFFLFAVPFIFILGSLLHFAYDFSNQNFFAGLIAPINESIYEHTKLAFSPTILWYILYFVFAKGIKKPIKNTWFTACLLSAITSILSIPLLFYFYTQAFGIELLWVDIFILLLAVFLGQLVAYHSYKYSFSIKKTCIFIIFILIVIFYVIFTIYPPALPIFTE